MVPKTTKDGEEAVTTIRANCPSCGDVQLTADDAAAGSADTSDGQPRTAARSSADTGQTAAGHP